MKTLFKKYEGLIYFYCSLIFFTAIFLLLDYMFNFIQM